MNAQDPGPQKGRAIVRVGTSHFCREMNPSSLLVELVVHTRLTTPCSTLSDQESTRSALKILLPNTPLRHHQHSTQMQLQGLHAWTLWQVLSLYRNGRSVGEPWSARPE